MELSIWRVKIQMMMKEGKRFMTSSLILYIRQIDLVEEKGNLQDHVKVSSHFSPQMYTPVQHES